MRLPEIRLWLCLAGAGVCLNSALVRADALQIAIAAPVAESTLTKIWQGNAQRRNPVEFITRRFASVPAALDSKSGFPVVLGTSEAIASACDEGRLAGSIIRPLISTDDAGAKGLSSCGVAIIRQATSLAFSARQYADAPPATINALFDPDRWPGKRALVAHPDTILEWAMMSYGVPASDVYGLLSSERGLKLAFARLERIRADTIWCASAACTWALLRDETVAMAAVDHTTLTLHRDNDALVIENIQSGIYTEYLELAVREGQQDSVQVQRFFDAVTHPGLLETLGRELGSGSIALRGQAGVQSVLMKDPLWYARLRPHLETRLKAWLANTVIRH